MKLKSDAHPLIQNFFSLVETQFSATIKKVHTDNGHEFAFHYFFASTFFALILMLLYLISNALHNYF